LRPTRVEKKVRSQATFRQGECQLSEMEKWTYLWDFRVGEGNPASMVYVCPSREQYLKILLQNLFVTSPKGWPD